MENLSEEKERNQPRENDQTDHRKKRADRNRRPNHTGHPDGFRGDHKDLQGFVYTYDSTARANQYEKTTKKISEWVEKELAFSKDIWKAITSLKNPDTNLWKPTPPGAEVAVTKMEESLFNEEIKEYMLRKRTFENNAFKVYKIVLGQCSEAMKAKLEGQD